MDVFEAIRNRRSVRAYDSRPIAADVVERMRAALRSAPSACNFQPWHFVLVSDAKLRGQLAHAANDQLFLADAPMIVVACGLPDQAAKKMGGRRNSVEIDVAIALDHLTLAAVEEGLGTCWIGAFREDEVKELLGIPRNVMVVALTPLGYPSSRELIHPLIDERRKANDAIFSEDRYTSV